MCQHYYVDEQMQSCEVQGESRVRENFTHGLMRGRWKQGMVNLNGHEAGNGGYSQEERSHCASVLLYLLRFVTEIEENVCLKERIYIRF